MTIMPAPHQRGEVDHGACMAVKYWRRMYRREHVTDSRLKLLDRMRPAHWGEDDKTLVTTPVMLSMCLLLRNIEDVQQARNDAKGTSGHGIGMQGLDCCGRMDQEEALRKRYSCSVAK